jgi:hypothetical protein
MQDVNHPFRCAAILLTVLLTSAVWTLAQTKLDNDLLIKVRKLYGPTFKDKITYGNDSTDFANSSSAAGARPDESAGSRSGDIASGVIIMESNGSLYLDTRPCHAHIVAFSKPYRKTKLASLTCDGKQLDRYQVETTRK